MMGKLFPRLVVMLTLTTTLLIVMALVVGDHLSGAHVGAFTTSPYKTHSMYVFDAGYGINLYIEFPNHKHEDEVLTWSVQARGVVFYPRKP